MSIGLGVPKCRFDEDGGPIGDEIEEMKMPCDPVPFRHIEFALLSEKEKEESESTS